MREYRVFEYSLPPEFPDRVDSLLQSQLERAGFDSTRNVWFYNDFDAQEVLFYQYDTTTDSEQEYRERPRFVKSRTPPFEGSQQSEHNVDINRVSLEAWSAEVDKLLEELHLDMRPWTQARYEPLEVSEA